MPNLRELTESDLGLTLETDFALPIELTSPAGDIQTVQGMILYDTTSMDQATGEDIIANDPVVTVRRSSLTTVPQNGENWHIRIPTTPSPTAPLEDFYLAKRPIEGGGSIGIMRLFLTRVKQI